MGHHLLLTWAASALAGLRCYDVRTMRASRIAALCAALSVASACGSVVPTTPSDPSSGTGLTLPCSTPTLLAGDIVVCVARAGSVNVSPAAVWTSSDPSIARPEGIGIFLGKSAGQATLTATYDGRSASAQLTVDLQDVLRATASFDQGPFRVSAAATMGLQGFYGVASANSGRLTLVITDQDGATVSTSAPLTVPHGGDRYLLTTTFTVPPSTTRVCRMGVLQIASTTLTVVPDVSLAPCIAVMP